MVTLKTRTELAAIPPMQSARWGGCAALAATGG